MIRRKSFQEPVVLHHYEGNAVGKRPFLVGAFEVKLSAALDQFTGSADALERRVTLYHVPKGRNFLPLRRFAQCIGQFQEHQLRGDKAQSRRARSSHRPLVRSITLVQECQKIEGVGKDRLNAFFGWPLL